MERFPLSVDPAASAPINTQLKEQIKWLIALGEVAAGDRLPTVQELSERLRINRNTVAQAYAELGQEGLLVARPRQGTFVADTAAVRNAVQAAALGRIVDGALREALALGYTTEQFTEAAAARAQVQAALCRRGSALFVECNWPEIEDFAGTVHAETGIALTGVHLDEVRADPGAFRQRAIETGLVITTLFHLEEVQAAVGPQTEVIGLGAGPEVQFLRSLAQLPRGTTVAICCIDRDKATSVRTVVVNAGVQHLKLLTFGVTEDAGLQQALEQADAVYVSRLAFPEAVRLVPDASRLRKYQLSLDRAGLEMLKARLAEMYARPAPEGAPARR